MTEAEFRKKAEAIKERYSKFVFYFDKRRKKNFVLFLSEISIPTACYGENIFVSVSSIKLHMPKTQETNFAIRLSEAKINYNKVYFSTTNCNLAYDSIENIFERIDNTLKQYIKLKKDLLKRKLEKL